MVKQRVVCVMQTTYGTEAVHVLHVSEAHRRLLLHLVVLDRVHAPTQRRRIPVHVVKRALQTIFGMEAPRVLHVPMVVQRRPVVQHLVVLLDHARAHRHLQDQRVRRVRQLRIQEQPVICAVQTILGTEARVLRVKITVQQTLVQHLVLLEIVHATDLNFRHLYVHARQGTLGIMHRRRVIYVLQTMCGMEAVHVLHVDMARRRLVVQRLVVLDRVRVHWGGLVHSVIHVQRDTQEQIVIRALQTMHGTGLRVFSVPISVQ